jgi:hypothetical protein
MFRKATMSGTREICRTSRSRYDAVKMTALQPQSRLAIRGRRSRAERFDAPLERHARRMVRA